MNSLFKYSKKYFCDYNLYRYKKSGARIAMWRAPSHYTESEAVKHNLQIYNQQMIENNYKYHPKLTNPTIAHRVLELVNPGEFDRIRRRDNRRRKDRAVVRDFCNKIMYIHEKHIPH